MEKVSNNEREMVAAFKSQSAQVLADSDEGRFDKDADTLLVGLEVEYGLLDNNTHQGVEEHVRDLIVEKDVRFDVELGASQIEQRTDPVDIKEDPIKIFEQLIANDSKIQGMSDALGVSIVKSGTNPFIPVDDIVRTTKPKYQQVPEFHNLRRRNVSKNVGTKEVIDNYDAAIIGITNSVQANIEARDELDAIDKLNRSFMIGPITLSLFSNSNIYEGKDIGVQDARMILWEKSHDIRTEQEFASGAVTGVGLPKAYYSSLVDYFDRIGKKPFILHSPENALQVGIGINWRDARIKVIDDSLVVEFRPVSTQPTPEGNYSAMMFYIGRLLWSQAHKEPLLVLQRVKENRDEAMLKGRDADLYIWDDEVGKFQKTPAASLATIELQRSIAGLKEANIVNGELFGMLTEKLNAKNHSSVLSSARQNYISRRVAKDGLEATFMAMNEYGGLV